MLSFGETVALFYGLDSDVKQVKQVLTTSENDKLKWMGNYIQCGTRKVMPVKMGSGNVHAAIEVTRFLSRNSVDLAISYGPAGYLEDSIATGEIFLIDSIVAYQKGTIGPLKEIKRHERLDFASDPEWQFFTKAFPVCGKRKILSSGEAFIQSSSFRDELRRSTGAALVDMNGYGVSKACQTLQVPLILFRVASDPADDEAGSAFRQFTEEHDSAAFLVKLLNFVAVMPSNPNRIRSYPNLKKVMESGR